MPSFKEEVKEYRNACSECNVPEETVMCYLVELTQKERYDLYMHYDEEMPEELRNEFEKGMKRILNHEPMAHVLGYSWFYGYKFIVNPDVLIPRVETEELVGQILARYDERFPNQEVEIVDVGTGSGAIAIALAKEEAHMHVHASDISEEALEVAKENAKVNEAKVDFMSGDMLQPLIDRKIKLDILISNPPYIPQEEVLEDTVSEYEPHVALFGGEDGLKFYRDIFQNCKKVLKEKSFMAFEIGYQQKDALLKEVRETLPDSTSEVIQDMNGKDRMLFVYFD